MHGIKSLISLCVYPTKRIFLCLAGMSCYTALVHALYLSDAARYMAVVVYVACAAVAFIRHKDFVVKMVRWKM